MHRTGQVFFDIAIDKHLVGPEVEPKLPLASLSLVVLQCNRTDSMGTW